MCGIHVDYKDGQFNDVTSLYVSDSNNGNPEGRAVLWIDIEEIDGCIFLCGRIRENAEKLFEITDGKFVRCEEKPHKFIEGLCLYSDGEAVEYMVDANIQREDISISEKAKAYRMKYEAMKHQGMAKGNSLQEMSEQARESRIKK